MTIEKGSFVKLELTGKTEDGNIFDTTSKEVAEENDIDTEELDFEPIVITIGSGDTIQGVEEAVTGMSEGEEKEVEVPPEKGFGERDSDKVRVVSKKVFDQEGITPRPGMMVNINNQRGKVQSVSGGRVRVDFNHPLAGKNLFYDIKVAKVIEELPEKAGALAKRFFPEDMKVVVKEDTIEAKPDQELLQNRSYPFMKRNFVSKVFATIDEINEVDFNEAFKRGNQ